MVFENLVSSFRVKSYFNKALLYSIFCLALFLYVISLKWKLNQTENILTDSTMYSEFEKEYRKKFNLLDRVVEADEECTLGC